MKIIVRLLRFLATAFVFVVAAVLCVVLWRHYMYRPWTRDGRVRAEVVKIAPDVAGLVSHVYARDNKPVKKGEVLLVIDQSRYKLAVVQAEAQVGSAEAQVTSAEARIRSVEAQGRSAEAQVAAAEAEFDNAKSERDRRKDVADNVVSREEKERAAATFAQTSARLADARSRLEDARSRLTDSRAGLTDARSRVAAAQSALELAKLNLERTEVKSPVNGYVSNLNVFEGDYAQAGAAKLAVVDSDSFWIYGYFEETKLPAIRVGDTAEIRLMSGGEPLIGHVESIARGISDRDNPVGAEGLSNVNPTFSWVRLAQRVPVRVHIDEAPDGVLVAAGMTCTIAIRHDRVAPKPKARGWRHEAE